jgi:adenylosuccinate synthase
MTQRIVVLSGVIGAGKSTLANGLEKTYGARVVKTRELLDIEARHRLRILHTREEYQEFGELRDIETGGAWVANALAEITRRGEQRGPRRLTANDASPNLTGYNCDERHR